MKKMTDDEMMNKIELFVNNCTGMMIENNELHEGFPAVMSPLEHIDEKGMTTIGLKEASEKFKEEMHWLDIVDTAKEQLTEDKVPWICCINSFMGFDQVDMSCKKEDAKEVIENIMKDVDKKLSKRKTAHPKGIEILQIEVFDGENIVFNYVARVYRSADETNIGDFSPIHEFAQTLDKTELSGILKEDNKDE